ncbi:replication initiation protein [Nocardioides gansuensis]|uniref:Replication initiation protein n=1 Tax=Nocardioides gansuensis TaxID=2138300 RepID=A0A2T8FCP9_9ACTN|nr:replication initiation protein [Nocardioides gansuensis]
MVADALLAAFPQAIPEWHCEPAPGLGIDPAALTQEQVAEWVGHGRWEPFAAALERVGNCARPIRLRGSSMRVDAATGQVISTYASAEEPDGLTYVRCGNRRESSCPSCSRLYAGDTFQLIRAGVVGGKSVPEHVAENPLVFATLTAPSFGRVHGRRDGTGLCHPRGSRATCAHGRPRGCTSRHSDDDPMLGQPLCAECYDYDSHVIWQWWAPSLWRRVNIGLRRGLAKQLGVAATRLAEVATLQYAKVGEFQARGAIHFHALIRLDGPKTPEGFAPADTSIDAVTLARLVRRTVASVRLEVPGVDADDPDRVLAFGRQVDARPVTTHRRTDDAAQALAPEQVAGYLAKYATKSASEDHQENDEHHRRLRATCRRLAERSVGTQRRGTETDEDRVEGPYDLLDKWVHMYGFRGHFATKSRRYSITLGALRRARQRAQSRIAEHRHCGQPLDLTALEADLLAEEDEETTLVIGNWTFVGSGWANETERTLALAAAARAREYDRESAALRKHTPNRKGTRV